jgi:hypothetical protein
LSEFNKMPADKAMKVLTRAEFEKLPRTEKVAYLAQVSPPGLRIAHDTYNGFHAISDAPHRKGAVVYEEPALSVNVRGQNLSKFCCMCAIDVGDPEAAPVVSHIFQDGGGAQHTMCICAPCGKRNETKEVPRTCREWAEDSVGDMGTLIWTIHALQLLNHWWRRREDFARAMLLSHR